MAGQQPQDPPRVGGENKSRMERFHEKKQGRAQRRALRKKPRFSVIGLLVAAVFVLTVAVVMLAVKEGMHNDAQVLASPTSILKSSTVLSPSSSATSAGDILVTNENGAPEGTSRSNPVAGKNDQVRGLVPLGKIKNLANVEAFAKANSWYRLGPLQWGGISFAALDKSAKAQIKGRQLNVVLAINTIVSDQEARRRVASNGYPLALKDQWPVVHIKRGVWNTALDASGAWTPFKDFRSQCRAGLRIVKKDGRVCRDRWILQHCGNIIKKLPRGEQVVPPTVKPEYTPTSTPTPLESKDPSKAPPKPSPPAGPTQSSTPTAVPTTTLPTDKPTQPPDPGPTDTPSPGATAISD